MMLTQVDMPQIKEKLDAQLDAGEKLLDVIEEFGPLFDVLDAESIKNIARAYRNEQKMVDEYKLSLSQIDAENACKEREKVSELNKMIDKISRIQARVLFHTHPKIELRPARHLVC